VVVTQKYPNDIWHGWKYIQFGPDGFLYVPVGAPCNYCNVTDLFGTLTKIDVSDPNADPIIVARGLRNSVGFAWHPDTKELWFTDNGRDEWGNDRPPDELNRMQSEGLHFGFPYCYGKNYSDPIFNVNGSCLPYVPSAFELGPHVAALGMVFYTGDMFPQPYRSHNRVFIAEHGSWNRDTPLGYRITTVDVTDPNSYQVFIEGWLPSSSEPSDSPNAWGRPTNLLVLPDGSLLISDDKANAIYRVTYEEPNPNPPEEESTPEGFGPGAIAAIVVSVVILVFGTVIGVLVFLKLRRMSYQQLQT